MKFKRLRIKKQHFLIAAAIGAFLAPLVASAHEVYVLSSSEISMDLLYPPINLFAVAVSHKFAFLTAVLVGVVAIVTVLGISLMHSLSRFVYPFLMKIKPAAAYIAQIAFGSAILAAAYNGALFGTELPFTLLFGSYATLVTLLLYISGFCVLIGVFPRLGAIITIIIFFWAVFSGQGIYMLSYLTYFGEGMVILLVGGEYSLISYTPKWTGIMKKFIAGFERRKSFFMRVCFATALIYAALYAKLLHGELALNTVLKYHLTNYFHFDPLFIVLGAFLVEMLIGIFFLIGFEIRFTAIFFLSFLTASLIFFGEAVWPHIVLIGTSFSLLAHGYDEYTVEKLWFPKDIKEPVL